MKPAITAGRHIETDFHRGSVYDMVESRSMGTLQDTVSRYRSRTAAWPRLLGRSITTAIAADVFVRPRRANRSQIVWPTPSNEGDDRDDANQGGTAS